MSYDQIIGLVLALGLMLIGLAGSVLPGLPSTPIVLIAAILHRLYFGESSASWLVLAMLIALTVFSLVVDYLAGMFGARKMGATWRGVLGAVIGAIVGVFFNLPGIILGPFIGALLFELLGKREFSDAARAGIGATIGIVVGAVGKLACCVVMIGLFTFSVVARSGTWPLAESLALR